MQIVLRLILFKILIVLLRAVKRALDYESEEMNRMNEENPEKSTGVEEKDGKFVFTYALDLARRFLF